MSTLYDTLSCLVAAGSDAVLAATVTAIRGGAIWIDLDPPAAAIIIARRAEIDDAGGKTTDRFTLVLERDIGHVPGVQILLANGSVARYETSSHERISGSLTMACERVAVFGEIRP